MGRPREFDVDHALAAALDQFWRKGFEGTSVTDLTAAMGITKPSLYATFGNKEELFQKALDSYQATCMVFIEPALAEPTARQVVERMLYGYADAQTDCAHPPGCLGTNAALVCSEAAEPIRQQLIARRTQQEAALERRLEIARDSGDLPTGSGPGGSGPVCHGCGSGNGGSGRVGRGPRHLVRDRADGVAGLARELNSGRPDEV